MSKKITAIFLLIIVSFFISWYLAKDDPNGWLKQCCPGFFYNDEKLWKPIAWYYYYGINDFYEYSYPRVEKDNKKVYPLSNETNNIVYSIDKFKETDFGLRITGWAFIKDQGSENADIYLCLKSDDDIYAYHVQPIKRPDVTLAHQSLNRDNAGFSNFIRKSQLQEGIYKVGIYIVKEQHIKALQYTDFYIKV